MLLPDGQGIRSAPLREADERDARPDPEPLAGAEGRQESPATRSAARRVCGKVCTRTWRMGGKSSRELLNL